MHVTDALVSLDASMRHVDTTQIQSPSKFELRICITVMVELFGSLHDA